jgi:DNA replication initiation complex subunit (GINS family)
MITFNEIYEALRKEKYNDSLQLISKNFLKESKNYFNEKTQFLSKESDIFSDMVVKNKIKLENAMANFKDLLTLRKKKILNLAFIASETGINKKDFENMLGFEKDLFESIVKSLEKSDKDKENEMQGNNENEVKHKLVRFLEDVPAFLNIDGEEIGPFNKGEVANLDNEIVDILSSDKRVELIIDE